MKFATDTTAMKKLGLALGVSLALSSAPVLAGGSFSKHDADSNGQLSKDEFYGTAADMGRYSDWDANSDGLLDENEWNDAEFSYDLNTWDGNSDGYVDAGEFYDSTFDYFDEDNNDYWSDTEWDDAGDNGWLDV